MSVANIPWSVIDVVYILYAVIQAILLARREKPMGLSETFLYVIAHAIVAPVITAWITFFYLAKALHWLVNVGRSNHTES